MSGRRLRPRRREDEATGLAGWLYTDLLLGLAVVFLGAITFTAAAKPKPIPTTTTTSTTSTTTTSAPPTTIPAVPCTLRAELYERETRIHLNTLVGDDALRDQFNNEINNLLFRLALPAQTRVGFALVFGAGNTDNEGERNAKLTADRLRFLAPDRFGATPVRPLHDASLRGAVNIDVFFLLGDCS